jgi:hypothetical protein
LRSIAAAIISVAILSDRIEGGGCPNRVTYSASINAYCFPFIRAMSLLVQKAVRRDYCTRSPSLGYIAYPSV